MATEAATGPGEGAVAETRERPPPPRPRRHRVAKAGWYVVLTALSVVILFPVYMLILRAIRLHAQRIILPMLSRPRR